MKSCLSRSGEALFSPRARSAPFVRRNRTHSKWPMEEAMKRGVCPRASLVLRRRLTSDSSSDWIKCSVTAISTSTCPSSAAKCRADRLARRLTDLARFGLAASSDRTDSDVSRDEKQEKQPCEIDLDDEASSKMRETDSRDSPMMIRISRRRSPTGISHYMYWSGGRRDSNGSNKLASQSHTFSHEIHRMLLVLITCA